MMKLVGARRVPRLRSAQHQASPGRLAALSAFAVTALLGLAACNSGTTVTSAPAASAPPVATPSAATSAAATSAATPAAASASAAASMAPSPSMSPAGSAVSNSASPAASAAAPAGPVQLNEGQGGPTGQFLTDANGRALYIFKKDTNGTSTCYGGCAALWPPLLTTDVSAVTLASGVTGTVGVSARTDGTKQVTFNGAPLYYYSKDVKAGDTNGQGIGNVWFLATPTGASGGSAAPGGASPPASPSGSGTSNY